MHPATSRWAVASSLAHGQTSPGIAHPLSRLCPSDLRRIVPDKYRALTIMAALPQCNASSASCASGQRFANRLPSDSQSPAKPLPSANSSPCRASKGLAPSSGCAMPGAPRKKAPTGVSTRRGQSRRPKGPYERRISALRRHPPYLPLSLPQPLIRRPDAPPLRPTAASACAAGPLPARGRSSAPE